MSRDLHDCLIRALIWILSMGDNSEEIEVTVNEDQVDGEPEPAAQAMEEDSIDEDNGGEQVEEEQEEGEDLEDPHEILREKCRATKKCAALQEKLDICNERVRSRKHTEETCEEELFDFVHCVDHCAAKTLFSKLK